MTNTELKNNIDAAITNKTSVSSITPVNVGEQIKSTVDYIDQEISNIELLEGPQGPQGPPGESGTVALQAYKVYSALISQSGTGIPIAKVLENTTGVNFSYTINSTGNYMLTGSSNVFTANKTATICSFNSNGSFPNGTMFFYSIGSQFFIIETRNSGTPTDGIITDAFIEIRVYN